MQQKKKQTGRRSDLSSQDRYCTHSCAGWLNSCEVYVFALFSCEAPGDPEVSQILTVTRQIWDLHLTTVLGSHAVKEQP